MLNNAPIDVISARMVTVTKGMRILQHRNPGMWITRRALIPEHLAREHLRNN